MNDFSVNSACERTSVIASRVTRNRFTAAGSFFNTVYLPLYSVAAAQAESAVTTLEGRSSEGRGSEVSVTRNGIVSYRGKILIPLTATLMGMCANRRKRMCYRRKR